MVHSSEPLEEQEDEGVCNLILVAVEYTGEDSTTANDIRQAAAWPGSSTFNEGEAQLGLTPDWSDSNYEDRTVDRLFSNNEFDVIRDPEEIAAILLDRNYLPPDVFSSGYEPRKREALFDLLDLDPAGVDNDDAYREQLREIAGRTLDEDELQEVSRDAALVNRYKSENTWDELVDVGERLGMPDVDANTPPGDIAEWLADQDNDDVRRALDDPYWEPELSETQQEWMEEYEEHDRGELMDVVGEFDHPFENISHKSSEEIAEFLAFQDREDVLRELGET